jgi:hypothetical protein
VSADAVDAPAWLVCSDAGDAAVIERAVLAGINGWLHAGDALPRPAVLRAAAQFALAARRRDAALRAQRDDARGRLDERKWVERAKGVLMRSGSIDEGEAFKLLRDASMHAQQRVGDVSRAVIDAARIAESINRAGQLRMLSQRLVRLAAQWFGGIDARVAATALEQAQQRVAQSLEALRSLCVGADAEFAAASAAWAALQPLLRRRAASATSLAAADAAAAALLEAAEALTMTLEARGGHRAVQIVNLCGRQRMRAQRIAKDVLLGVLLEGDAAAAARARAEATARDFDATLTALEHAPLSSASIRDGLAAAHNEWLLMQRGIRGVAQAPGRLALVASSERLLEHLEALTAAYETSLQVILG